MAGQCWAGTLLRVFHISGALEVTPTALASAVTLPSAAIALSSASMFDLDYSHLRESTSHTNVMQGGGTFTNVKTVADRLKEARKSKGLNQEQLAKLSGVSPATIANIEVGTRKNPRNLLQIAKAVGRSPQWLMTGRDDERTPSDARPGAPPDLFSALEAVGVALAAVPKSMREAVATNLAGWARDGGADHWRVTVQTLLAPQSGKRSQT